MTAITSFDDALAKMATKGFWLPITGVGQSTVTQATVGSGFFTVYPQFNGIMATLWTNLVGSATPNGPDAPILLSHISTYENNNKGVVGGWLYKLGTLNLAAAGDQFTHHAATFPMLRTRMGVASQPVRLLPVLFLDAATTTTAAVFTMKDGANTVGYVDQDGNTVVGTKTFTMPAAVTAINSGYVLQLETTDTAVRDIQQINVATPAAVGSAIVFGFEPLMSFTASLVGGAMYADALGETLVLPDMRPAVATAGTAEAIFMFMSLGVSGQSAYNMHHYAGFKNS